MNVHVANEGHHAIVRLEGRLDAEWAEHLSATLSDLLRGGTRSAILEMSGVQYASSAAARILSRRARDFAALRGELLLVSPSPSVLSVLVVAGLRDHIFDPVRQEVGTSGELDADLARSDVTREWRTPQPPSSRQQVHGRYEVTPNESGAVLSCRVYGRPELLADGFSESDCRTVVFSDRAFGLGIGAISGGQESACRRMGELVSAGGVVAYMPTDGAMVADYLCGDRGHEARADVATAIVCEGSFSHLARFATGSDDNSVTLSELSQVLLDAIGADAVGLVMVAECAGLVGAALRRSPAVPNAPPSFTFPDVRSWLALSAEPAHSATTALVVGVAVRRPASPMAPHLRPLGGDAGLHGHFHAVVFSYTPVPQRTMTTTKVVASLFEQERIRGVLHLLYDDRERVGAGESEFRRGLVWAAPVGHVVPQHDR